MAGYYIHDSQDDSYISISDGLDMPWIELTEERYGDAYAYPAIYNLNTHQVLQPVDGEDSWGTYSLVEASYYIYNSEDDSYINISDGLNMPWIELSEETYGNAYTYPAIYNIQTHQVLQPADGEDSWGTYSLVSFAPDEVVGGSTDSYYVYDQSDDSCTDISELSYPWIQLSEETYGDAYTYPAIYNAVTHEVLQPVEGENSWGTYALVEDCGDMTGIGVSDSDGDGFVDSVTNYQMWTALGGVDLTNRRGQTYSDETSRKWDAVKAVEVDGGFSLLVEGHRNKEGKFKVASANDEGVVGGTTRWLNGNQMFNEGYENLFEMDFNGNSEIGF